MYSISWSARAMRCSTALDIFMRAETRRNGMSAWSRTSHRCLPHVCLPALMRRSRCVSSRTSLSLPSHMREAPTRGETDGNRPSRGRPYDKRETLRHRRGGGHGTPLCAVQGPALCAGLASQRGDRLARADWRCDPDLCLWASAAHSVQATEEERLNAGRGSCVGERSLQRNAFCSQQGLLSFQEEER